MHSLPIFVRLDGRAVILIGEGEAAGAKRRLLERAGAHVVGETANAALAIVALDDDADAEAASTRLKARGILVNVVDRPHQCDFTLPAIVDRDPVLVAIGTGGASAGLAAALRQRFEALLPADLGALARALFASRDALKARYPDPAARRRAISVALADGGPFDPMRAGASDRVDGWIDSGDVQGEGSGLVHIALTSDDPDDLTLGAARALARADHVFHAPGVAAAILDRARADAPRTACAAPPDPAPEGLSVFLERR